MKNKINSGKGSVKPIAKKKILFFNSFEESEEFGRKQMAMHTYAQRLENLATLRRRVYKSALLPNGKWPKLARTITIISGSLR